MTPLEWFIAGYIAGIISTFTGIMVFAKYMTNKETYIEMGRKKWNKEKDDTRIQDKN